MTDETTERFAWKGAGASYALLLAAFWAAAQYFRVPEKIGGHLETTFAAFALLFAPFWFFGFGAAAEVRRRLRGRAGRIAAPSLLLFPYLLYALPRGEVKWQFAAAFVAIPVGVAALLEMWRPADARISVQDVVALLALGLPIDLHWLGGSWPHPGLASMPKLLFVDAALYAYLVVRQLPDVGYDFRPRLRDLATGLREWCFYAPLAIGLGLALHFIYFHRLLPPISAAAAAWLVTFFLIAVPEEMFFRGLFQNMLQARWGKWAGLAMAAAIFGLSHFNKAAGPVLHGSNLGFNWRYVLLAALAGVFYGRAWQERKRILSSGITHATVDVVWSLWFR